MPLGLRNLFREVYLDFQPTVTRDHKLVKVAFCGDECASQVVFHILVRFLPVVLTFDLAFAKADRRTDKLINFTAIESCGVGLGVRGQRTDSLS